MKYKTTDPLTDKAFSHLMITSVLGILVTIVMLCSATWAWFATDISFGNNSIQTSAGSAQLWVQNASGHRITDEEDGLVAEGIYRIEKDTPYTVFLEIGAEDTANAYCEVKVDGISYYGAQIFASSTERMVAFTLQFTEDHAEVSILPRWGIPNAERSFVGGGFYLDLVATDPSTVEKPTEEPTEETTDAPETEETPAETTETPEETTETPEETTETPEETAETPAETDEIPET